MSKTQTIVKWIVRNAVAMSASYVVVETLKNNVEPENKREKAQVYIGAAAIGALVNDVIADHTDAFVDDLFSVWNPKPTENTEDTED